MSLKLGVIGTGAIGRDHIRRCSQALLNSQVVAVTDINLEQAAQVVQQGQQPFPAAGLVTQRQAKGSDNAPAHAHTMGGAEQTSRHGCQQQGG